MPIDVDVYFIYKFDEYQSIPIKMVKRIASAN